MCMEDIRINRKTGSQTFAVVLPANTLTPLVEANPYRLGLQFGVPSGSTATIGPEGIAPSASIGFALVGTTTPVKFLLDECGLQCTKKWSGFSVGGCTVTVMEYELEHI